MTQRVVFDTGTVVSALRFREGRLAWLRPHWQKLVCVPLVSAATVRELLLVLNYPKLRLSPPQQLEVMAEYLPWCETVDVDARCEIACRDAKDQMFLDLAQSGRPEVLVTGDSDLLVLAGRTRFAIESPEDYRQRFVC